MEERIKAIENSRDGMNKKNQEYMEEFKDKETRLNSLLIKNEEDKSKLNESLSEFKKELAILISNNHKLENEIIIKENLIQVFSHFYYFF